MSDPEHEQVLSQGVREWNRWRQRHPDVVPDLSRGIPEDDFDADVRTLVAGVLNQVAPGRAPTAQEGLSGADLSKANLRNADLSGAFLDGAMLVETDLRGADLDGAHMTGCVLTNATMRNARMREVDLTAATLRWADISGADLSRAVLRQANLNEVKARRTRLHGADLAYSTFVGGSLVRADLSRALVYGASVWDVDLTGAVQEHLIITRPSEPEVSVNDLKVAQFLHLIISNRHIRDVVDTLTTKVVLVLGRFTGERKAVLDTVHAALRRRGFVPVLFDFERPASRDFTETVVTLAHLSRFIVADLTDPASLPKELEAIVPRLAVPLLPLLQRDHEPYAMFSDYWKYDWVLGISRYADAADLVRHFNVRVLRPVEQAVQELAARRARSGQR
jgi:hypothetical protein